MPSNAVACIGQRSACAVRITRLGSDCTPLTGASNTVITAALVTATLTPDVEAGQKYEPKNACGSILYADSNDDVVKRYNVTMELGLFDYELIELMTSDTLILGATTSPWSGKVVGVSHQGPSSIPAKGVGIEIWVKNAQGTGACGPAASAPPYTRHVLPRARLRTEDRTYDDAPHTYKVSGVAEQNVLWTAAGPYADQPVTAIDVNSPWHEFYDTDLPATGCGFLS